MPAIAHQNKILGNTSGGGSTILVTTSESSLYGQTITLSDGTTTLSGTFSNTGECEFTGVMMTGNLTLACGGVSQNISVPYFGNYSFVFSLFSATVNVTYPYSEGASCTLSDGTTTLIATGSPMAFTVPNAGTWTASVTLDGVSKTDAATITTDGQVASISIIFGTINVTYDNDFRGLSITCVQGGTTITKTAPSSGNTMYFYPPTTGNWTISGTVSSDTFYSTPNPVVVSSLSTSVSATLRASVSVNVTLYSAVEDTLSYTDAEGAKTAVFSSGQSSKSVTLKINPSGQSITFTSTVAKNPSNLSANYSKTIAVTTSTTSIYIMPENCLYWYGYIDSKLEVLSTANGWSWSSSVFGTPVFNKNSIYVSSTMSYDLTGVGTKNPISLSKGHVIYQGGSGIFDGRYGDITTSTQKTNFNGNVILYENLPNNTLSHGVLESSSNSAYLTTYAFYGQQNTIYALWYE